MFTEIIVIAILIVLIYIFFITNDTELMSVNIDNNVVLVRKLPDYKQSSELLYNIIINLFELRDHLVKNKNNYPQIKEYIEYMEPNFTRRRTLIYENAINSSYTSYCVNKGEEIVFCMRFKPSLKLHDLNTMMYVAIHEMAHTACPQNGHPPLFSFIFRGFLQIATVLNIYKYVDYSSQPIMYCGMDLNSQILN